MVLRLTPVSRSVARIDTPSHSAEITAHCLSPERTFTTRIPNESGLRIICRRPEPVGHYGLGCCSSPQKHSIYSQLIWFLYKYVIQKPQLRDGSMVKNAPDRVNALLFRHAVGALCDGMLHEELALSLDCSQASVRAALSDPDKPGFRNPPGGWEVTVRRLLEARADHFAKLAQRLKTTADG
jgi:hypothetical protein